MEQTEENPRGAFFEQLMTVRMPTAGLGISRQASPGDRAADVSADDTDTSALEEDATVRVETPHTLPAPFAEAPEADAQSPRGAARESVANMAPASVGVFPAPRRKLSRQRRAIAALAFTVLSLVVAMVPVLSYVSASQPVPATNTSTFGQNANPPAGWHPQNWATLARQQAEVRYVNKLIAHMTLDQEIGQMIMLGFLETQMSPSLAYSIKQFHLGSVILYAWNITGADQVKQLTSQIQAEGEIPLLIATDQEGGSVNRLQAVVGPLPSATTIGATGDPNYARQRGIADARQLAALGINVNFAPVVDVANTGGGDLGGRTFGDTPNQVTTMAGAYLSGLQSSDQVVGTLKHFPGLGDVPADPHQTLYTLNRSESALESIDWSPYKALITNGTAQMIMSTHVVVSAIDPTRPASLSKPVLTGVLRDQLGYQGVIVTDGIYMGALTANYTFDQIIVDAVEAGNDIICSTYSIASTAAAVNALENAVRSGEISKSRIDESVRRILLLKLRNGVLTMPKGQ
jgi:beta-glucosidase-like glycosyl hydrolase